MSFDEFPGDIKICAEREFLQKDNFKDKFKVAWKFAAPYINKDLDEEKKTPDKSIRWRKIGNNEYNATPKNKDYLTKSIEAYTKSIAYGPVGSTELSLAYGNRSAVLYKARLYDDCLVDIERALKSGYPDNLKTKLFIRQALCFKVLKQNSDIEQSISMASATQWLPYFKNIYPNYNIQNEYTKMMNELGKPREIIKFIPVIKNSNSIIVGGSDKIDIKITNNSRQHIVAKKMIKTGEFIYINEPFAANVINELNYTNCWHCCRSTWAGVPCDNCPVIIYCSDQCKKKASDSYHNIECLVLASLLKSDQINTPDLLTVKIFLKTLKSAGGLFELNEQINNIDSIKNKGFMFFNGKLDVNTIDNFRYLDYIKATSSECKFESALLAVFIVTIFIQKTNILDEKIKIENSIKYKNENIFILGKLILRYMMVVHLNSPYLTDTETGSFAWSNVMVPFCKILKKSCDPNVDWTHFDSSVGFYAIKPIKQGKPIFVSMIGSYHTTPRIDRYIRLASTTNDSVPCQCTACVDNCPTIDSLQSYEIMSSKKMSSKKIKTEFDSMMQELNECKELFEERDNTKLLTIKDNLNSINDKFHQYITDPCKELSTLYLLLKKLYEQLQTVNHSLE